MKYWFRIAIYRLRKYLRLAQPRIACTFEGGPWDGDLRTIERDIFLFGVELAGQLTGEEDDTMFPLDGYYVRAPNSYIFRWRKDDEHERRE